MAESQPEPQPYVVDASVASKWYLKDEALVAKADALRDAFDAGRITIAAPDQFRYEVANAIRNGVRADRITRGKADEAIAELLTIEIRFASAHLLLEEALDICLRLNTSLYDALYLAHAELIDAMLISADNKFRRALGGNHPRVVWLEDYQPGMTVERNEEDRVKLCAFTPRG